MYLRLHAEVGDVRPRHLWWGGRVDHDLEFFVGELTVSISVSVCEHLVDILLSNTHWQVPHNVTELALGVFLTEFPPSSWVRSH